MSVKKYNPEFIQKLVTEYMENPVISQKELARKYNMTLGSVAYYLKGKNGVTSFQRYKRNRDNRIRVQWEAAQNRLKKVREQKKSISTSYGLTQGMIYQIVKGES